ncbi:MAG: FlgD immunoglobulin-like domain containing protein [Candidatus Edwardsbacteria bacterium]|nr:FlgD immunoglobulin-like domain containing protein [Candidatus Edwardsbacteria bacterium]
MKKTLIAMVLVTLAVLPALAGVWVEDFEPATFPPDGWSKSYNFPIWSRSTKCSGYGTGVASAKADFYNTYYIWTVAGRWEDLITLDVPPTGASDSLKFDHAYACYSSASGGEKDTLRISTSTDGGSNWTELITLIGGRLGPLNTGGYTATDFVPTAAQWATKMYTIPTGTNKIKFMAKSAAGNNLYIDNVKISSPSPAHDVCAMSVRAPAGPITPKASVSPQVLVKNMGQNTESFNTTCNIAPIGGSQVYSQTLPVTNLAAGATQTLTFPSWSPDSGEMYTVSGITSLAGDLYAANDTNQSTPSAYYSPNRVMVDQFTCTSCAPCVAGNDTMNDVYRDLKDSLTLIRTHVWWPTNNDPYYLGRGPDTMENRARRTYNTVSYVPWITVGGIVHPNYTEARAYILSQKKIAQPLTISLEGWYDASGDSGVITAVIKATGRFLAASKASLTLRYAITEDSSLYTGTNGDPIHHQVLRDMIPDNNGVPIAIDKDQTVVNSQKYTIYTGGVVPYTWTEKNCQFVVYVQNDVTKEVLQSATCGLNAIPPSAVELCAFTGMAVNGGIALQWRTSSEFENAEWLIERSTSPGEGFIRIAEVAAENNPNGHIYSYTDRTTQPYTDYYYRLGDKDIHGKITWNSTVLITSQGVAITKFWLAAGRPNPCRDQATFEYALPQPGEVSIRIFDICGRLVSTLPMGPQNAGLQQAVWDLRDNTGKPAANGVYFFRMTAGEHTATRKITVLR